MKTADCRPFSLMQITPHWKYTWPPWTNNTFRSAVSTTSTSKGAKARTTWISGMRDAA